MASISADYNKNGELYYIIRIGSDHSGQRVTERFYPKRKGNCVMLRSKKTDAMALKYAAELEARVKKEKEERRPVEKPFEIAISCKETFQQIGDKFIAEMDSIGYAGNTQSNYKLTLKKHIYPVLGGYSLSQLTEPVCEKFLQDCSSTLGKDVCKKVRMIIGSIFDFAITAGLIKENPIKNIKLKEAYLMKRHRVKKREMDTPKTYSMEQIEELKMVMNGQPLKWRVYFTIVLETGIRRGECCAIRWENIDFNNGELYIDRSCNYTAEKGIFFDLPKSGKTRTVMLGDDAIELLKELQWIQAKNPSEYVFTQRGKPDVMFPQVPTKYFHNLEVEYSLPFHCNPHKFRHTFASLAARYNTSQMTVSALLGHSDLRSSERYEHPYTKAEEVAAKRVIETIGGSTIKPSGKTPK